MLALFNYNHVLLKDEKKKLNEACLLRNLESYHIIVCQQSPCKNYVTISFVLTLAYGSHL